MRAPEDRSDPGPKVAAHHRSGSGVTRVPYPIGVRAVAVGRREQVTPRMLRLTLGGPGLAGFHTYHADDHVKIVFPDVDGVLRAPVPNDRQLLDWPRPLPPTRDYTIRRFDPDGLEVDVDVVLHDGGLASTWAAGAEIGEEVTIAGPPGGKAFPYTYDHYVFAVDATGLPAVARWLESAPPGVSADVVVADEGDYPLPGGDRVTVHRPVLGSALAATVDALPRPPGRTFLFAAGEAGDVKPLRSWRRGEVDALVTGYWKRGVAGHDED